MFDLVIIGLGPAGLTAAIYASRYRLNNLVVGNALGGTISLAHRVENYPGFESISGLEWSQKTETQAKKLGSQVVYGLVEKVQKIPNGFRIYLRDEQKFDAKSVIIATGTERKKLNIPGETGYVGKGVSYCTTCDAPFFSEKIVALIGGADAAVSGAIHTAEFASKVYIIYRKGELRAEPVWVEEALKNPKIEVIYNTNLTEIVGDGQMVTGVKLDTPYHDSNVITVDGVFIEIGAIPGTGLAASMGVQLDEINYILVGEDMSTNVSGVFAAGDLTDNSKMLSQMIHACAQGAIAAASVYKYIKGEKAPQIVGG